MTPGLLSVVASPDLRREGAYGTAGVRLWCLDPSKKCSARASGDAGGWEEESRLVRWNYGRASTRKAERKDRGREGSRRSRWLVEKLTAPEPR